MALNRLSKIAGISDAAEVGNSKTPPLNRGKSLDKSPVAERCRDQDKTIPHRQDLKGWRKELVKNHLNDMEA